MPFDLGGYPRLKLINIFTFLWFTAANVFVFSLAFTGKDKESPDDLIKYGYGLGRETLVTPAPWAYFILFLIHASLGGTVFYAQFTERGKEIVLLGLVWRFSSLMLISTLWTGLWIRQLYWPSLIVSAVVFALATNSYLIVKEESSEETGHTWKDEVFIHLPFSLFHGWSASTLARGSENARVIDVVVAAFLVLVLSGLAAGYAFIKANSDIYAATIVAWGQFAIFDHQLRHGQPVSAWIAFGAGCLSLLSVAYGVWRVTVNAGQVRLEGEENPPRVAST